MNASFLTLAVVGTAAFVVIAVFVVLWQGRSSSRTSVVAVLSGMVLVVWLAATAALALRGIFLPPNAQSAPPVGIDVVVVLFVLTAFLSASSSLRSLLANQRNLIRLNVWRLAGIVFLILMWQGQVPALWALPAGIGDIIVGATAPWVATRLNERDGTRLAVVFNVFGILDLVVAVGLGVMTNPGPAQMFLTAPTSELITRFPLVLVPTFLVPLAFVLHAVSLWQLARGSWMARPAVAVR